MRKSLWALFLTAACCCGGGPDVPELPIYSGPRDPATLCKVLSTRYGWTTMAASGTCTLKSKKESRTFNFELLADRPRGILVFTGDKALTGTLFRLQSTAEKTQLEDFTQDEPSTILLDPSKPLDVLGGGSVGALRTLLLSWPPRGELHENEGTLTWDTLTIDKERLSLKKSLVDGLELTFKGDVEMPKGRVRPVVWLLSATSEESLSLALDNDVEFDADLGSEIP